MIAIIVKQKWQQTAGSKLQNYVKTGRNFCFFFIHALLNVFLAS
jgi:hypothetical protein